MMQGLHASQAILACAFLLANGQGCKPEVWLIAGPVRPWWQHGMRMWHVHMCIYLLKYDIA